MLYEVITDGPEISDVIERYTELTGRFQQPPEWALGLHQSKWGYTGEEILNVARTYREKQIPLDVMHLDIDYMDGYRVFTWGDCCADPGDPGRSCSTGRGAPSTPTGAPTGSWARARASGRSAARSRNNFV